MGCLQLLLGSNSKFYCVWKGKVEELGCDIMFSPFSLPNYNINKNLCFWVLWRGFLILIFLIWVPLTTRASIIFLNFLLWPQLTIPRKTTFRPHLGGRNGMELKWMKKIILEYSSLPLFGNFNGGNEKLIPLFRSLSGRE